jgi:hypothetical protein
MPRDPIFGPRDEEEIEERHKRDVADSEAKQSRALDFLRQTLAELYPDLGTRIEDGEFDYIDDLKEMNWPFEEIMRKAQDKLRLLREPDINWELVQDLDDLAYEISLEME